MELVINPNTHFTNNYNTLIQDLNDCLTYAEIQVLKYFSFVSYKDCKIYPKQTTIAKKLKYSVVYVKRLIKHLEQKGFIKITRSSLVERRSKRKGNTYHFLYNPAYDGFERVIKHKCIPDCIPESYDSTFISNKVIKTSQGGFFSFRSFFNKKTKAGFKPDEIQFALNELEKNLPVIRNAHSYCNFMVKINKNDKINNNERNEIKEHISRTAHENNLFKPVYNNGHMIASSQKIVNISGIIGDVINNLMKKKE